MAGGQATSEAAQGREGGGGRRGRRRRRRLLLIACIVLVVLAAIGAALAPAIAGSLVPGIVADAAKSSIAGKVTVSRASLSWFGKQTVGPITVQDDRGEVVATVSVEASRGLFGLLKSGVGLGSFDLGKVTMSGEAMVVRSADGSTNISRLIKPAAPSTGGSSGGGGGKASSSKGPVPPGLAAELEVTSLNLRLIDEGSNEIREVDIRGMTASAKYAAGGITAMVNAPAFASTPGATPVPAGTLKGGVVVTNIVDASGNITPRAAGVEANLDASDLSTEVIGVLSGLGHQLTEGVGKTIRVSVRARGGMSEGDASVAVVSDGLNANLAIKSAGGVVSATAPGSIRLAGAAVKALMPAKSMAESGVAIEDFPGVNVTIDSLRVPVPAAGAALDWKAAGVTIGLSTTAVRGTFAGVDKVDHHFEVAPLNAEVDARDLAGGAKLSAKTTLAVDGAAAGVIGVDLSATGLVDASGLRRAVPPLTGQVVVSEISTAAAQKFVEKLGVDLPAGIGPRLDVTAKAKAGDQARTDVELKIKSSGLNGTATAEVAGMLVKSRGEFSLRSPRTLAGRALDGKGVDLSTGGFAKVVIRSLECDISKPADSAQGDLDVSFGGFTVAPTGAAGGPVEINQIIVTARASQGAAPQVILKGSGKHQGGDFLIEGDFKVPELATAGRSSVDLAAIRPVGVLRLNNMPMSLASLATGAPAGGGPPGKHADDAAKLIADVLGPTMTVVLSTAERQGSARGITLSATSANLNAEVVAALDDSSFTMSRCEVRTTMTPAVADALQGEGTTGVKLASPAALVLTTSQVTVPMKGLAPRLEGAGDVVFKLGADGEIRVRGALPESGGSPQGAISGIRDLSVAGTIPLAALASGGPSRKAEISVSGLVIGEKGEPVASLTGKASADLSGATLVGEAAASLAVAIQDSAKLDQILGRPGVVSGAVGPSLTLTSDATMALSWSTSDPTSGTGLKRMNASLAITSPRIATTQPLRLSGAGDRVSIDSAMVLTWKPDVAWINDVALAPQRSGAAASENSLRVTSPPECTLRLTKLVLPVGGGQGLLKPGVFQADLAVESPQLSLAAGQAPATLKSLMFRMASGSEPGVIGFSIRAADLGAGGGPGNAPALLLEGGLYRVADGAGNPTPKAALLTMKGEAFNAPSAVLDALANQGGMLAELLGPIVAVSVRTQGVNEERGTLVVSATSPRAELELTGEFAGGTFKTTSEPRIVVHSVTPALGKTLVDGLPLIGSFEKKAEDGPAQVKAQGLVVPLDGHVERLNGDITVELGMARFETSRAFGALLRLAKQRDAGLVGRRLQPLVLNIKNGVMTYQRWKLPLGDFTVDTRGTVDLVNRKMDVVTYIPFGALSDEVAGKLNTGLGRLLGSTIPLIEQATMIPFHTTGSFENPKTEPDMELFVKEAGQTLLRPDRLLKDGLQKLIKPDEKK